MKNYEIYGNTTNHFSLFSYCDPIYCSDSVKDLEWQQAMDEEIRSVERNVSLELTNIPDNQKTIDIKWFYKTM